MARHPVRLTVEDDLRRSRLTVFFRLLLALPHLVWLSLWTIAALFVTLANWFATLVTGRSPAPLHRFLAAYVRYTTHVNAYILLAANPFPGFTSGPYPVDVEIDPPERQNRWVTGFRLFLAVPVFLITAALMGGGVNFGSRSGAYGAASSGGVATTVAILAWFACLVRGRMPQGFRDLLAYILRYVTQVDAYVFLLTDRYPDSDPSEPVPPQRPPRHPVRLTLDDDLRRSRLTVFFRFLLWLPHLVWLFLWGLVVFPAALANWAVTLVRGTAPGSLHRFLAVYVRYATQAFAYLLLVANPFPGFTGGPYPVDVEIDPPERQSRWVTGFRLILGIPALLVASALGGAGFTAAFLGWFAALALGRMPLGLRNLGAYSLRYSAQTYAYLYVLTERYPFSGPASTDEEPRPAEPATQLAA